MNCDQIQSRLSAYIDRQLPAWENQRVAEHTAGCIACRQYIEPLLEMKRALRGQRLPGMPPDLRAVIEAQTLERAKQSRWPAAAWFIPALAAAAAGWMTLQHLRQPPRAAPVEQAQAHPQAPPHPQVAWQGPVRRADSEQTQ